METAKSARPITSRPLTGREILQTGLIAPKSSRGKTGLRRQVQDKSYFVGLLRSKINEINAERTAILKECDIMTKEESRIGVYRQKAEALAKELGRLTTDLATYNEFLDRIRVGDDAATVREDANDKTVQNKALIANLENAYTNYKACEAKAKQNEDELQKQARSLNAMKNNFSEEQKAKFTYLQNLNAQLTKESHELENEIARWKSEKMQMEKRALHSDNILKMQVLQAAAKLTRLKKHKLELHNSQGNEDNERSNLLAEVKRDNNYIASLEAKIEQFTNNMDEMRNEIHFYRDGEKLSKFSDLKQKQKSFAEFEINFENEKKDLLNRMEMVNNEINDISSKLSRSLKYLTILRQINEANNHSYQDTPELIIKKRKIQLQLNTNLEMMNRIENEREMIKAKMRKLEEGIQSYSDVGKLKTAIQDNLAGVKKSIEHIKADILQFKTDCETIASEVRDIRIHLDKDDTYAHMVTLQHTLTSVLKHNQTIKANDNSQMMTEMKNIVLELTKKYNQNLMGF